MHIAASGYYGMGNFGDDLFLHTLRQVFHDHHVYPWNSRLDPRQTDAFIIGGGDLITPYSFNSYYFPPRLKDSLPGSTVSASWTPTRNTPGLRSRYPPTGR